MLSFEELSKLKRNCLVYEHDYGMTIKVMIIEDAVVEDVIWDEKTGEKRRQVRFKGVDVFNPENEIDFLSTEGLGHYGPKIYDSPEYVKFGKKYHSIVYMDGKEEIVYVK